MRPPDDPRRPRRISKSRRSGLIVTVAVVMAVFSSLRGIASLFTDYLFFDELHATQVWRSILVTKLALAGVFTVVFFGLVIINLYIAERLAPKGRVPGPQDELTERYRALMVNNARKVRLGVAAVLAVIFGYTAYTQWLRWLLFRNGGSFGVKDPLFHTDVSFYMFKLPLLSFVVNWLFFALVVTSLLVLIVHYLNGGIRLQILGRRVTPQVKAHLSLLLALLALLKAADYWLQRYELALGNFDVNLPNGGVLTGTGYTAARAQLPALRLLVLISLAAALLLVFNIFRRGWTLPVLAVGLWGLVALVAGGIYPAFVQRVQVRPSIEAKERKYIGENIVATRQAYQLDAVKKTPFAYEDGLPQKALDANSDVLKNVRLWEPSKVQDTYQRLQGIQNYFQLGDLDVDRYTVKGAPTQTLVSVRELDSNDLPNKSWVSEHLQFTHGYGAVVSPTNAVSSSGDPLFSLNNIPTEGVPELTRPQVYFGEQDQAGFAVVGSKQPEIDFGAKKTTTYAGSGGVQLSSALRRAAFALRFNDSNLILSDRLSSNSRILYNRTITQRAKTLAPFLSFDVDPYSVIVDGKLLWIQDAYTTSADYPFSQYSSPSVGRLDPRSGLNQPLNYVRNSVKVVTDAYDGSVTFYVMDNKDPLIKAYSKAFPHLFTSGTKMPGSVRAHLRYPEDLFKVQADLYGRYQLTDPASFFDGEAGWSIATAPNETPKSSSRNLVNRTDAAGVNTTVTVRNEMEPAYLLLNQPGVKGLGFAMMQPYSPISSANTGERRMTGFLTASSDPGDYGTLRSYQISTTNAPAPASVGAEIDQEDDISRAITQLDNNGSQVTYSNIYVLPINNSLLFVRSMYVQSSDPATRQPEINRVIVANGKRVSYGHDLPSALAALNGLQPPSTTSSTGNGSGSGSSGTTSTTTPSSGTTVPGASGDAGSLTQQALASFTAADAALKAGDLAEFQRLYKEGVALTRRANAAASAGSTTSTTLPQPGGSA